MILFLQLCRFHNFCADCTFFLYLGDKPNTLNEILQNSISKIFNFATEKKEQYLVTDFKTVNYTS